MQVIGFGAAVLYQTIDSCLYVMCLLPIFLFNLATQGLTKRKAIHVNQENFPGVEHLLGFQTKAFAFDRLWNTKFICMDSKNNIPQMNTNADNPTSKCNC